MGNFGQRHTGKCLEAKLLKYTFLGNNVLNRFNKINLKIFVKQNRRDVYLNFECKIFEFRIFIFEYGWIGIFWVWFVSGLVSHRVSHTPGSDEFGVGTTDLNLGLELEIRPNEMTSL